MGLSRRHIAGIGIAAQFLALIRILAEYLRLFGRQELTPAAGRIWVIGALITAVLTFAAVTSFFFRRYAVAIAVAILTVVVLLIYKGFVVGF